MYVARILYPVKVLGPGNRVGIWMVGCKHGCKGCSNPELWEFQEKYKTSIDAVMYLINQIGRNNAIDGFTITGGEPLEQSEELSQLLPQLRKISTDILMYTGYDFGYVEKSNREILDMVSVIIDGKYIEEQNTGVILRGSENQNIHILDERLKIKYEAYLNTHTNGIQNFCLGNAVISVGIHEKDYADKIDKLIKEKIRYE